MQIVWFSNSSSKACQKDDISTQSGDDDAQVPLGVRGSTTNRLLNGNLNQNDLRTWHLSVHSLDIEIISLPRTPWMVWDATSHESCSTWWKFMALHPWQKYQVEVVWNIRFDDVWWCLMYLVVGIHLSKRFRWPDSTGCPSVPGKMHLVYPFWGVLLLLRLCDAVHLHDLMVRRGHRNWWCWCWNMGYTNEKYRAFYGEMVWHA